MNKQSTESRKLTQCKRRCTIAEEQLHVAKRKATIKVMQAVHAFEFHESLDTLGVITDL